MPSQTSLMTRASSLHAFAFQTGNWEVHHRKLARRLQGCTEWIEFGGTCSAHEILGGAGNIDDFFIEEPGGAYRAATFRRIDPETGDWLIYWADSRRNGLDAPMRGHFEDGVGTFFGDDNFAGRDVRVRFRWSEIEHDHARWEQAFSFDGEEWEVNWVMHFRRVT